jgi:hypothetical protein
MVSDPLFWIIEIGSVEDPSEELRREQPVWPVKMKTNNMIQMLAFFIKQIIG